jgi:hypothetical protein
MAVGMRIAAPVAEGVQLDWEAILRPSEEFIESVSRSRQKIVHVSASNFPTCPPPPLQVKTWMYPEREAFMLDEEWPLVAEVIPIFCLLCFSGGRRTEVENV